MTTENTSDSRLLQKTDGATQSRSNVDKPVVSIPVELSSFIGRNNELHEIKRRLSSTRLLTLSGPGGCGKSRLGIRTAQTLTTNFSDGVYWVGLESIFDPQLVPELVVSALRLDNQPGRSSTETIIGSIGSKKMLLVLDNCEHLLDSCAELAGVLLSECPSLKILATSREALNINGESNWQVSPLTCPSDNALHTREALEKHEATQLFVDRATAALPKFELNEHASSAVVNVCRKLEGIPLAVELAAARVNVLTVEQIADRLDECFTLLATNRRIGNSRQQTLRNTMDWSHGLLTDSEQTMFRRLSVFSGGFTFEAVERVCLHDLDEHGAIDLLSRLIDKSLVIKEDLNGIARYRMLETVRQYSSEKLAGEPEDADEAKRRHAFYFLGLSSVAGSPPGGADQTSWVERLEREHNNFRVALWWFENMGDAEHGLRLIYGLQRYWWIHGDFFEIKVRLESLLRLSGTSDWTRAIALQTLGLIRCMYTDYSPEDLKLARSSLQDSLDILRELEAIPEVAAVLLNLGCLSAESGNIQDAYKFLSKSMTLSLQLNNPGMIANANLYLGITHFIDDDLLQARVHLNRGIETFRELNDKFWITGCLAYIGYVECKEGNLAAARSNFEQMNETLPLHNFPRNATFTLEGFARLAVAQKQAERAVTLAGATESLRLRYGVPIGPPRHLEFQNQLAPSRQTLGEATSAEIWHHGECLTLEAALEYAFGTAEIHYSSGELGYSPENPLSKRELEVLSLVAEGLTDSQTAERLFLSTRTVSQHLRSIYRKLETNSRTGAIRKAGTLRLLI